MTKKGTYIITVQATDGAIFRHEVLQSTLDWACRWVSRHLDLTDMDTVTIHRKGA